MSKSLREAFFVVAIILSLVGIFPLSAKALESTLTEVIVDNTSSNVTRSGKWCASLAPNPYGTGSLFSCGLNIRDTFRWTPSLPEAGEYEVFLWWTAHANRTSRAPITIGQDNGTVQKIVNQQINGGKWNFLGSYQFSPGKAYIEIDDRNGQVSADAVKFVRKVSSGYQVSTETVSSPLLSGSGSSLSTSGGGASTVATTFEPLKDDVSLVCSSDEIKFYDRCVKTLQLFGQHTWREAAPNETVMNSAYHAAGVVVDRSSNPNKIYVVDTGNNRVFGFDGFSSTPSIVIGQSNFQGSACNGDTNLGALKTPNASTLCLTNYPAAANVAEQWLHINLDVDAEGNLYVVDVYNNRVLKYNAPFSVDKSDGKGDSVADFVWGQDNFISNLRNKGKGKSKPSASSLWVSYGPPDNVAARGVSVDADGNVWIADTFNNRILRFPKGGNGADLVIGRPNVTDSNGGLNEGDFRCQDGAPLNVLCSPTLAKVNPKTGELYVLNENPRGFKARILVFKPPFENGMLAYKTIKPIDSSNPQYYFTASSFAFDPFGTWDCSAGKILINEHAAQGGARTIIVDGNGIISKRMLLVNWPSGSLGFDNDGNVYIADESGYQVRRFRLPSGSCSAEPVAAGLILGRNAKQLTKFSESVGTIPAGDQLIVKDQERLMAWNNYSSKPRIGAAADVTTSFGGGRAAHTIDDKNRLWTYNKFGQLVVFSLPLQQDATPLIDPIRLYWADDGSEVQYWGNDSR